jgi:hypothetical protein
MTEQQAYLKAEMIAAWPQGSEVVIDWQDPNGPGPLIEALACTFSDYGMDVVAALRAELSPLSCSAAGVALWEQSLALVGSKAHVSGTLAQQRAQVIARLREYGQPNAGLIRSVINQFLQYANQAAIIILESSRIQVRAANQVTWTGSLSLDGDITFTVRDDPKVSPAGAQVDLCIQIADLAKLNTATLRGPDGTTISAGYPLGRGGPLLSWLPTLEPSATITAPIVTRSMSGTGASFIWAAGDAGAAWLWNGTIWINVSTGAVNFRSVYTLTVAMVNTTWVVGDGGLALYTTDAATWHATATGTTNTLYGVWSSNSATWAAGAGGLVILYSGGVWAAVSPTGTVADLFAIWGTGNADVWAVGVGGTIIHYTGAWATLPTGTTATLRSVWGTSPTDAWAVGDGGTILHWDGASWTPMVSGTSTALNCVWGSSTTTVWACGDGGIILYYDGTSWGPQNSNTLAPLYGMWGSSGTDVWAGGPRVLTHLFTGSNAPNLRLYFTLGGGHVGKPIYGTWTLSLGLSGGSATVTYAALLVEGLGRYADFLGVPRDGLGAVMYEWGVVQQPSLLGTDFDLDGAYQAILRLSYARSLGSLINGGTGGLFLAIPNDPRTIPGQCIP